MQFIGSNDAKTDAKGRVFFPANFRKILQEVGEEGLVLRKDVFQNCLVVYPESVWKEQLTAMRLKLSRWNKQQQQVFRQFAADAEVLATDSNGRILIPRRYREMAGIQQDVRFVGMYDVIEIWAKEKLDTPFVPTEEFGLALEELMKTSNESSPL